MKQFYPPLTWARIEQLAVAGHDDFETVTPPRARQLVESVRERFTGTPEVWKVDRRLFCNQLHKTSLQRDLAIATLERVKEALSLVNQNGDLIAFRGRVTVVLAGQPEAPAKATLYHHVGCDARDGLPCTHECATWVYGQPEAPLDADQVAKVCCDIAWRNGWALTYKLERRQPEAPKGQESGRWMVGEDGLARKQSFPITESLTRRTYDLERDLAAANARIVELEQDMESMHETGYEQLRATKDAQVKAERESERNAHKFHELTMKHYATANERDAANARADAAEGEARCLRESVRQQQVRADAAEREAEGWKSNAEAERQATGRAEAEHEAALASLDLVLGQRNALQTERDQLAARVKELESGAAQEKALADFDRRHPGEEA
jgi:hypothetical protein